MKRLMIFCCLLLIATGLFAASLVPYKVGYGDGCSIISDDMGVKLNGEPVASGLYFTTDTYALYDLKGQYRELSFKAGVSDKFDDIRYFSALHFYVDGVKVKTISFFRDSEPEKYIIQLDYKKQLKIVSECKVKNHFVVTDINFK